MLTNDTKCPVAEPLSSEDYAARHRVASSLGMMTKMHWLLILELWTIASGRELACSKRVYLARAEQVDMNGLRCWDTVKVPSCGGHCDSREVADWEFPFKLTHHPVCGFGSRRPLMVRLRRCDPGVEPGTELFHYIAADDCRCKVCSSQHTSCEWLPPNSTLLEGLTGYNQ